MEHIGCRTPRIIRFIIRGNIFHTIFHLIFFVIFRRIAALEAAGAAFKSGAGNLDAYLAHGSKKLRH